MQLPSQQGHFLTWLMYLGQHLSTNPFTRSKLSSFYRQDINERSFFRAKNTTGQGLGLSVLRQARAVRVAPQPGKRCSEADSSSKRKGLWQPVKPVSIGRLNAQGTGACSVLFVLKQAPSKAETVPGNSFPALNQHSDRS